MKITYRDEVFTKQLKGIKSQEDLAVELKQIEDCISEAKKLKAHSQNDFNGFKIICHSEKTKTRNKTIQSASGFKTRSVSKYYNKDIKNTNKNTNKTTANTIIKNRSILFVTTGSTLGSESPMVSERQKFNTRFTTTLDLRPMSSNLIKQNLNTISVEKEESSLKNKIGDKFNLFRKFFSKIINNMDYRVKIDSKVNLNQNIKNNIKDWKKVTKNKTIAYSSGSIALPLLTQLLGD
jgi:hypothetical protein